MLPLVRGGVTELLGQRFGQHFGQRRLPASRGPSHQHIGPRAVGGGGHLEGVYVAAPAAQKKDPGGGRVRADSSRECLQ